ncbi:hypothetical protein FOA52_007200 [Chlamydomonas sp. UWO 241]|nr:hypothetical protein FOA52_007200 [Chlamydomonas sp. UWO 241]
MGPKGKGGPVERVEARTTLTALLLADSFTQRFRPITVERPKALLPLVNVPLIEYTLQWLAMNKVEETFVFCSSHAAQIKAYLADSRAWGHAGRGGMRVTCIVATNCTSAGEALRFVDQRDVIKSDFVLVTGDVVSNMSLAPALKAHQARRAADKNNIMTMVMKSAGHPAQLVRQGETEALICLDPDTHRLLKYHESSESVSARGPATVKVDTSFFSERDNIQVRTDLIDTHIAICSPEVLLLFSDNFDYQSIKQDFVTGVLSEEELGNKLYVYELRGEYAACVANLRSYDAVSRDVLSRWAFPFAPDTNVLPPSGGGADDSSYRYARGHVYLEAQVQAPRGSCLVSDVVVGALSVIGDGCHIAQSVIGRRVHVGKGATIIGSYVHDGAVIGDRASLCGAIVCEGAVIGAGAVLSPGCVVSYGCVVGPKATVAPHVRLTLCAQPVRTAGESGSGVGVAQSSGDDSDEDEDYEGAGFGPGGGTAGPTDAARAAADAAAAGLPPPAGAPTFSAAAGVGGVGFEWVPREGFDVERFSIAPPAHVLRTSLLAVSESDGDIAGGAGGARGGGFGSGGEEDEEDEEEEDEDEGTEEEPMEPEELFMREVSETFLRCLKLGFAADNAVIELNGLKIAEDRTFADCARYIFTTLLSLCLPATPYYARSEYVALFPGSTPDTETAPGKVALLKAFKGQLSTWQGLLQRFLKVDDDQVELLLTFEEFCGSEGVFEDSQGAAFGAVFPQVLQAMYDADVLSEEALLAWADEKEHADKDDRVLLDRSAKFIEWLRTADDDDDEDDELDDDEEDEDDE